ncbi:unnamed protein product [Cyprideis torosa]|uniref:Uncharacterized protein n=1 Tax=Cyprideis torosa TaxID=163714 RepID=A0A7R8WDK5_9CRUS|nr:unnamed protein product [Cyprideis torosa]CAG0889623.1 unnamed protein product [Cyprideis torosa]
MGLDASYCGKCSKILLFIVNFFILIVGLILWVAGIVGLVKNKDELLNELSDSEGKNWMRAGSIILLVCGLVIAFISFLGCWGTWKEKKWALLVYATILSLILLVTFSGSILSLVYKDNLVNVMERFAEGVLIDYDSTQPDKRATKLWDQMQTDGECCGYFGYKDWKRIHQAYNTSIEVPATCCKTNQVRESKLRRPIRYGNRSFEDQSGTGIEASKTNQISECQTNPTFESTWTEGCILKHACDFQYYAGVLGYIGLIASFIMAAKVLEALVLSPSGSDVPLGVARLSSSAVTMGKGNDDHCRRIARLLLFIINFLVFIIGLILLIAGIVGLVKKNDDIFNEFKEGEAKNWIKVGSVMLLISGVMIMIIAAVGWCGTIKESRWLLLLYATVLTVFLVVTFVGSILALVYKDKAVEVLSGLARDVLIEYDSTQPARAATELWDNLQQTGKCCGYYDYEDWQKDHPSYTDAIKVPVTCCKTTQISECQTNPTEDTVWLEGCLPKYAGNFQTLSGTLGYIGLSCCLILTEVKSVNPLSQRGQVINPLSQRGQVSQSAQPERSGQSIRSAREVSFGILCLSGCGKTFAGLQRLAFGTVNMFLSPKYFPLSTHPTTSVESYRFRHRCSSWMKVDPLSLRSLGYMPQSLFLFRAYFLLWTHRGASVASTRFRIGRSSSENSWTSLKETVASSISVVGNREGCLLQLLLHKIDSDEPTVGVQLLLRQWPVQEAHLNDKDLQE